MTDDPGEAIRPIRAAITTIAERPPFFRVRRPTSFYDSAYGREVSNDFGSVVPGDIARQLRPVTECRPLALKGGFAERGQRERPREFRRRPIAQSIVRTSPIGALTPRFRRGVRSFGRRESRRGMTRSRNHHPRWMGIRGGRECLGMEPVWWLAEDWMAGFPLSARA